MTYNPPVHLDAAAARRMADEDVTIDFTVHPALLPDLVTWLDYRGLDLMRVPLPEEADALPTYVVQPRAWRTHTPTATGAAL